MAKAIEGEGATKGLFIIKGKYQAEVVGLKMNEGKMRRVGRRSKIDRI